MAPEPCLRADDGTVLPLDLGRWHDEPGTDERVVLARVRPPVVDLGCGPGRHVVALAERGVPALGVDAAPTAVDTARARGALVLERSVFDRLPGLGRWGTVLLLDGNIGIGGDPPALLRRARALLRAGGRIFAELAPPGVPTRVLSVRLEHDGGAGPPFPWAVVSVDGIAELADAAGLAVVDVWQGGGRWFSQLDA